MSTTLLLRAVSTQRADVLQALETLQEEYIKKQASLAVHAQSIVTTLAAGGAHAPPVQLLPAPPTSAPGPVPQAVTSSGTGVGSTVSGGRAPTRGVPASATAVGTPAVPIGGLPPLAVAARAAALSVLYDKCKVWYLDR
jgi:hypothetical protein